MPAATHSSHSYRADIDGLRAVAVLAVVVFHAFPRALPGGFTGVDVFFVISGYLISGLVFAELDASRFSFLAFYARRVRRIFPALIVVLAALLAFGWLALIADEYRRLARHASAAAGFALNFVLWRESGYFDTAARMKPLLHLWSLAIEEQFYIVWPAILYLAWRGTRRVAWVVSALCAASFLWNLSAVTTHPESAFFLPLSRFWELLSGSLVAYADLRRRNRIRASAGLRNAGAALGFALVVAGIALVDETKLFPGTWALLPVAGTALAIAAGPEAWLNRAVLARRPCVAIGLISYPLYLWHWPLLSLASIIGLGRVSATARLELVALSFLLAWATYAWIERPIRFGAGPRRPRPFGTRELALAGSMACLAAVSVWIGAHRGFPSRLSESPGPTNERFESDSGCEHFAALAKREFEYCKSANPRAPKVVAVIGDSHARSLFPGIAETLVSEGKGALLFASSGCPALSGTTVGATAAERAKCAASTAQILELTGSRAEIESVVLTGRVPLWVSGQSFGEADYNPRAAKIRWAVGDDDGASGLPVFEEGLARTVRELEQRGKQVVYVLDVPELGFEPRGCVARPRWIRPEHACEIERREVDARQGDYRAAVARVARELPNLVVVDPLSLFCDADRCRASDGEHVLYDDDDHLSVAGSRLVAARLFQARAAAP